MNFHVAGLTHENYILKDQIMGLIQSNSTRIKCIHVYEKSQKIPCSQKSKKTLLRNFKHPSFVR